MYELLRESRRKKACLAISKRLSERAFTLVEVTIALGIMSFSMVVILGLIPVGLTTMRQAMDSTIQTQILQKISGETLLAPYSSLSSLASGPARYFDDEGQEQSVESATTRYVVTLTKIDPVYPGSGTATTLAKSLATIQVKIQCGPHGAARNETSYFNLSIANSGT